jgi:hypothetical protein
MDSEGAFTMAGARRISMGASGSPGSLPAAFAGLPPGLRAWPLEPVRFGVYTTIGCIPWTAALAYAGYAVGANWQSIVDGFRGPTYIIAAVVVIALTIAAWRYVRLHQAGSASAHGQQPDTAGKHRDTGCTR